MSDSVRAPARIAALQRLNLFDTPRQASFDRLTRLCREALGVPVAIVSVVDEERQFFKSHSGLPEPWATLRQSPLSHSFCQHVVDSCDRLVVADARLHPLVAENLAIDEIGVVAYAGFPLVMEGGLVVGAFAAIDTAPRRWTERELRMVADFADMAVMEIEFEAGVEERLRAERALREGEERFRQMAEAVPQVFWLSSGEGEPQYASPAFETITGRPVAELVSGAFRFEDDIHPDDQAIAAAALREMCERPVSGVEFRYRRADGQVRWLLTRGAPVRDASGTVLRVVGTTDDLTERRRMEETLRQAQRMEAVGRLAGGVAHDFNNMLTAIKGFATLLGMTGERTAEEMTYLDGIQQATDHSVGLTRQLLAFSRKQLLRPERVELGPLVERLQVMLNRLIGEDVVLATTVEPGVEPVRVDPGQIEQVLLNLAVNARDAMPRGGHLTLDVRTRVFAEPERHGDGFDIPAGRYTILSVSDDGCGMDEGTRTQVFEPFFTTKEVGKGTGLGLATVYGIVKQSGGFVWVESAPGAGSVFRVCLPVVEEEGREEEDEQAGALKLSRGSGTVFLVEDEPSVRALIRRVLEMSGYAVRAAANAREALELLRDRAAKCDLLITDVVMPGESGAELAARARELRPELNILFMSGYADEVVERYAVFAPGTHFIAKPFAPAELSRKVREVLSGG